jgi:hypothetical protein
MNALNSPNDLAGQSSAAPNPNPADGARRTASFTTFFRPTRSFYPNSQQERTVTLASAESGILLRVGERFLLKLDQRSWQVRIGDPTILAMDEAAGTPNNSQGYFEAKKPGETKIYASGDPPRSANGPPGQRPGIFLEIPVSVLP